MNGSADCHSEASKSTEMCNRVWMEMEKRATEKKQGLSEDTLCRTDVQMILYGAYVNTPMQLLELLNLSGQLGVSSLLKQVMVHILSNICASQSLEYISVIML